jgi:hypothetical protein
MVVVVALLWWSRWVAALVSVGGVLVMRGMLAVTEERADLSATIWCFRNRSSGGGYGVWYCVLVQGDLVRC